MIRFVLTFLFFPGLAAAEVVTIRSGEHDSFSRLVLSIDEGTDWTLDETENGYQITLNNHDDGFDVTEVFDRIPRDRISGIEQVDNDTLDLKFGCDCSVETFLWRPDRLVLDISDHDGIDESVENDEPILLRLPRNEAQSVTTDERIGLPDIIDQTNGLSLTSFVAEAAVNEESPTAENPMLKDENLSEAALLDGISRAASQGLLSPNVEIHHTEPPHTEISNLLPETVSMVDADMQINSTYPGVDISTALDQGLSGLGDALRGSLEQRCLPADLFEIANWGDGRGLHDQIAGLAESLAGEFGEEPIEAETDLARLYLHFGFGAEALAVLSISQRSSQARQVLYELGNIIDGSTESLPLLMSQRNCETAGALWSFIAVPFEPDSEGKTNELIRALFELPQPLRAHIAPKVSQAFLAVDMPDSAELVLRATNNRDVETDTVVQTTRALIAESNDDPDEALAILNEQANVSARMTPEAAIHLVTLTLEQGEVPAESDLVLLSALGHEFEGNEIAKEISVTEALGWSARGDYQRALATLNGRTVDTFGQTRDAIYFELTEEGPSADFLEFAMGTLPEEISATTENEMARRLIDLGFPDRALSVMMGPATRSDAAERRYLRAEASLDLQDYSNTIVALQGMNDDRARNLRAAAYSGLGEFQMAIEALNEDEIGSTPDLQFRAQAWERLTLDDDPVLSDFARTVVSEDVDQSSIQSLEDRRSLLAVSQESRLAVESLLLRFDGTTTATGDP